MKNYFTSLLISLVFFFQSLLLVAQINITSEDAALIGSQGSFMTLVVDTTTKSLNIGSPGQNSWDFSFLKSNHEMRLDFIDPESNPPFIIDFPGSNHILNYKLEGETEEDNLDVWLYQKLSTNSLSTLGMIIKSSMEENEFIMKTSHNPGQTEYQFPITYNSQWSYENDIKTETFMNEIMLSSNLIQSVTEVVVDAYGTMKMPGGKILDALRIRTNELNIMDGLTYREISYSFMAKNGARVDITAIDSTASNSGIVEVEEIRWFFHTSPLNVDDINQNKTSYYLSQNYPNPFNSSTTISYTIPEYSAVNVTIHDYSGRLISVLLNEVHYPGTYSLEIDGSGMKAGIYYYKIQTDAFVQIKKMTLIK